MTSRRSSRDLQPDRLRSHQSGNKLWRTSRASFDLGPPSARSTFGRASRTPSKGSNNGNGASSRSTFGGRTSRTPLRQSQRFSNRGTTGRPRMSSLSKGGDSKITQDPRDIKSKAFNSSAISHLIDFLSRKGFNQPLSRKVLSSPSTKEFKTIFEFMIRCVNPSYDLGSTGLKLEQEVHNVFRELGYPCMLNRQHLATVGAPHSWPYALAALDWLRELVESEDAIQYGIDEDQESDSVSDDFGLMMDATTQRVQRLYLENEKASYYNYITSGEPITYAEFTNELDAILLGGITKEQLEEMYVEEKQLKASLKEREALEDPLQSAKAEHEEVLAEEHRLLEELAAVETELEANSMDIVEAQEERSLALERRMTVQNESARLKHIVDTQPMRKEDEEHLLHRLNNLQAEANHLDLVNMDLLEANGAGEVKIAGLIESVEPKAIALGHLANELGLTERYPDLQIGVSLFRQPDTFIPRVQSALHSIEEEENKAYDDVKSRLNTAMRQSEQVCEELRQCSLLERTHREQLELMDEENKHVRERLHTQEEAMMEERLSWERKLLHLRESTAIQENELSVETERVRKANEALDLRKGELASQVAALESECRSLTNVVKKTLKASESFGEYLQSLVKKIP